jgi:hypothetical protein
MKVHRSVDKIGKIINFPTAAFDGDEWSATCSGHLLPGKESADTHWTGGCVGLRVGLDMMRKIPATARN